MGEYEYNYIVILSEGDLSSTKKRESRNEESSDFICHFNPMNLKNFDTVTRYDFMDTIMKYAQTLPFDVERVAESIGKHVYDEDINAYITDIVHQYRQGEIVIEIEVWNHLFDHI